MTKKISRKCLTCGKVVETSGGRAQWCGDPRKKGTCAYKHTQEKRKQYKARLKEKLKNNPPQPKPKKKPFQSPRSFIESDWLMY